jgi:hypothetical protein
MAQTSIKPWCFQWQWSYFWGCTLAICFACPQNISGAGEEDRTYGEAGGFVVGRGLVIIVSFLMLCCLASWSSSGNSCSECRR